MPLSRPITIVHLVERLDIGGLERALETIVKGLDHQKYYVEVWCLAAGGAIAQDILNSGIELRVLYLNNYYNPVNILLLSSKLLRNRVKILHTHGYFASTFGRIAGIIARVPILITHVQSSHWRRNKRHILVDKIFSKFTDKIVACSETARRFLTEVEGIEAKRVITIHNAVDLERFKKPEQERIEKLRKEFGFGPGNKIIGTVGRLDPVKGHIYLLEAAVKVLRYFPEARFIIVGDGPLRGELTSLANAKGISGKVVFAGTIIDIPSIMSMMDIFVLPSSVREGLPNVIPEAEASSKPVIASKIGGIPEAVVDGVTGLLVDPRNPNLLADKIIYLLENPATAHLMGEKGNNFCQKHFSSKKMVDKMDELYSQLLWSLTP